MSQSTQGKPEVKLNQNTKPKPGKKAVIQHVVIFLSSQQNLDYR